MCQPFPPWSTCVTDTGLRVFLPSWCLSIACSVAKIAIFWSKWCYRPIFIKFFLVVLFSCFFAFVFFFVFRKNHWKITIRVEEIVGHRDNVFYKRLDEFYFSFLADNRLVWELRRRGRRLLGQRRRKTWDFSIPTKRTSCLDQFFLANRGF